MNPARTGLNALAIFAILLVLGLGFAANAAPGAQSSEGYSEGSGPSGSAGLGYSATYSLVPLPLYLHQPMSDNFPFKEGGALLVAYGTLLELRTSFLGAPDTTFVTVVQTAEQNITAGTTTTSNDGAGSFRGNITLSPGTFQVGLLVYVSGNDSAPVALSSPRETQVTLGTSTSSTQSSTTESQTRSETEGSGSSSTTQTSLSTSSSESQSQVVQRLHFVPAPDPLPRANYPYGNGTAGYVTADGSIYLSLAFTGQSPNARFSLLLSVNGTSETIGNYTTDSSGSGHLGANSRLGQGTFVLSLTLVDLTSFGQPTPVLVGDPRSFTVETHSSTTISTTSATTSANETESSTTFGSPDGQAWAFKLVPAHPSSIPPGYRFAASGTAIVSLDHHDDVLNVVLGFQDANPSTAYEAVLVLNGTDQVLGSMTTSRGGSVELHSSVQVNPGSYLLGVKVYDVSNAAAFNASSPVLVMVSSPATQLALVRHQQGGGSTISTNSTVSEPPSASTSASTITTESEGTQVESRIKEALSNLTIPAAIQITPLTSSTDVYDSRFSLSLGQQANNGLVIAISGENVTGPRVLLINMSRTYPLALFPALNVTLDGMPVSEASSASEVLNPLSTNPPYYVIVGTSSSIQLLVSIPHFSLHLIQVAGIIVHNITTSLEIDAPILVGSMLVVTLIFAGAYAARKRYFTILV
jgi:hypothetical protein